MTDYQQIFEEAQEQAEHPARPGAVLRCFSEIKPEPLRFLWPGRFPLGKLNLLVGDPGKGKSLLAEDITSRTTRGTAFPDGATCKLGAVIIASAEDDPADTIRPRLDVAGADVDRVHILEGMHVTLTDGSITERAFNLETGIPALEDALNRVGGVRLVVIDPISAYLGGVDSNTNSEVRGCLAPLAALAAKYEVAVLAITHLRKSAGPAVHRAIASIAFTAAARAVWAVASDPADANRRLMLPVKQNLAPDIGGLAFRVEAQNGVPRLNWEPGAVSLDPNEILDVADREVHSERQAAEQWLLEYLQDGPVGARETIRAASDVGISKMMLWRASNALHVVRHKLGGRGAGWEWSLPPDSKISAPIYTDVKSLKPLESSMKTKVDSAPEISKISKISAPIYTDVKSLPLLDQDGGEEDGEVRV